MRFRLELCQRSARQSEFREFVQHQELLESTSYTLYHRVVAYVGIRVSQFPQEQKHLPIKFVQSLFIAMYVNYTLSYHSNAAHSLLRPFPRRLPISPIEVTDNFARCAAPWLRAVSMYFGSACEQMRLLVLVGSVRRYVAVEYVHHHVKLQAPRTCCAHRRSKWFGRSIKM